MPPARLANVGQLALRIDFSDTASNVREVDIALFVNNDAGAGMSPYRK